MGTVSILPWIAHPLFWVLLLAGWLTSELSVTGLLTFIALWLAGFYGLPHLLPGGFLLVPSYVAILDIVLVFVVLKGDVRLR
jgi:hypothetical protein